MLPLKCTEELRESSLSHPSSLHLTPREFEVACRDFAEACQHLAIPGMRVWQQERDEATFLVIRRYLHELVLAPSPESQEEQIESIDEGCDMEMASIGVGEMWNGTIIEYRIHLSPSYYVPVLHFHIPGYASNADSLKTFYQQVVPPEIRPQLEEGGVMGGLSLTYDPVSNIPCFFVHPCRTVDALRTVAPKHLSHIQYLELWIGLIGPCVGLQLPKELAMNLPCKCEPL